MGTGYSPPGTTRPAPPRVHLLPPPSSVLPCHRGQSPGVNMVVGLKSVDQLSLGAHFSGSRTITEVYNLATAGIPNDH